MNAATSRALRALLERWSALPPYPTAGALAVLVLCLAETVLVRGGWPLAYLVHLFALAVPEGALLGALLGALVLAVERTPARWPDTVRLALWPALGAVAGLLLAGTLGAFVRLGTHYDTMAKSTLAVSIAGGAGLGALIASLQPTRSFRRGYLVEAPAGVRALASVALVAAACGASYADHTLYVGLYIPAHIALRLIAALSLLAALAISARELLLPRLNKRSALAVLALLLIPLAALHEDDSDVVQALVTRPWPATVLRAARATFDLDRDGFSFVLGGGDCNDWNRSINPGAREVPGNGIDDNCLFGDRAKVVTVASLPPVPKEPAPMSVVLITLDTMRWDRLGRNDPSHNATPRIDRWSQRGVVFRKAYTAGTWTSIALNSLMRGMHARRLTWQRYYETTSYRMVKGPLAGKLAPHERPAKMFPLAFEDPHAPLAALLKRRGMRTVAIVDDGFTQMLSKTVGLAKGFDTYHEVNVEPTSAAAAAREKIVGRRRARDDATTADLTIKELREHDKRKQPFFMWAHFFGAHPPSRPHKNYPKRPRDGSLAEIYDYEVRFVDAQVGRVLGAIGKLDRKVAVILTSDHGESFFSRYRSHGSGLHDDELAIPMVAVVPGWKPQTIETPVSLIDVLPTILGVTATPAPTDRDGIDLATLLDAPRPSERILLADTWQFANDNRPYSELVAAFDGKHKVVLDRLDHSFSFYDQTRPDAPPLRIDGLAHGKLARSVLAYLEDTGGLLNVVEAPPPKRRAKKRAKR